MNNTDLDWPEPLESDEVARVLRRAATIVEQWPPLLDAEITPGTKTGPN